MRRCCSCGKPSERMVCEECRPTPPVKEEMRIAKPRRLQRSREGEDPSPWQENAIRQMDDGYQ